MEAKSRTEMIEPGRRKELVQRLNRIEGQVRGIREMVEEDRRCIEILQQISSAYEALRGVSRLMAQNYLETCATDGIRSNDNARVDETYQELLDIMYKFTK